MFKHCLLILAFMASMFPLMANAQDLDSADTDLQESSAGDSAANVVDDDSSAKDTSMEPPVIQTETQENTSSDIEQDEITEPSAPGDVVPDDIVPEVIPEETVTADTSANILPDPHTKTDDSTSSIPMDTQTIPRNNRQEVCDESISYPSATMRRAETAYTKRKYSAVIDTLKPISDNISCVDDADTIIEINLLLGVSNLELGNARQADDFFLNVLYTDPDYDPVSAIIVLPSSSTERIEKLRDEHAAELDALRPEKSKNTVVETLFVQGKVEQRAYWMNFVPFGAGLFQMHENVWGGIYASVQLTGILMSILGGGMVEYYREDNYLFTSQNYKKANAWQATQIVGIALLGVGYVANVIHALTIFAPAPVNWHSPSKTPPSMAAAPVFLKDGAGIAFETHF